MRNEIMLKWLKKRKRNAKKKQVRKIAQRTRDVYLRDSELDLLSFTELEYIVAHNVITNAFFTKMGYDSSHNPDVSSEPNDQNEWDEASGYEEIERIGAEELARVVRESKDYISYEDERPDFMNAPIVESHANEDRFGKVEYEPAPAPSRSWEPEPSRSYESSGSRSSYSSDSSDSSDSGGSSDSGSGGSDD